MVVAILAIAIASIALISKVASKTAGKRIRWLHGTDDGEACSK